MMKTLLLSLAIPALSVPLKQTKTAITPEKWLEAWKSGDASSFDGFFARDAQMYAASGDMFTAPTIQKHIEKYLLTTQVEGVEPIFVATFSQTATFPRIKPTKPGSDDATDADDASAVTDADDAATADAHHLILLTPGMHQQGFVMQWNETSDNGSKGGIDVIGLNHQGEIKSWSLYESEAGEEENAANASTAQPSNEPVGMATRFPQTAPREMDGDGGARRLLDDSEDSSNTNEKKGMENMLQGLAQSRGHDRQTVLQELMQTMQIFFEHAMTSLMEAMAGTPGTPYAVGMAFLKDYDHQPEALLALLSDNITLTYNGDSILEGKDAVSAFWEEHFGTVQESVQAERSILLMAADEPNLVIEWESELNDADMTRNVGIFKLENGTVQKLDMYSYEAMKIDDDEDSDEDDESDNESDGSDNESDGSDDDDE